MQGNVCLSCTAEVGRWTLRCMAVGFQRSFGVRHWGMSSEIRGDSDLAGDTSPETVSLRAT